MQIHVHVYWLFPPEILMAVYNITCKFIVYVNLIEMAFYIKEILYSFFEINNCMAVDEKIGHKIKHISMFKWKNVYTCATNSFNLFKKGVHIVQIFNKTQRECFSFSFNLS